MRLRPTRAPLVAALVLAVLPLVSGPSYAEPGPVVPSQQDVARARAAAADRARDVGAIEAGLVVANQRLEQAAVRAEQASEAYNGALWRLRQAETAARAARAAADRAHRRVGTQRTRIGALVAQSYQQGGDLSAMHAMLGGQGIDGVLDQYAGFQGASTSLQADYQRFAASQSLAEVFEQQAETARTEQVRLATAARAARDLASSAARAAQGQATAIAAQKVQLVRELARAQDISVSLARTRQAALEQAARERARAQARARARALAAAAAKAETPAPAPATPAQSDPGPAPAPAPEPAPSSTPSPAPAPVVAAPVAPPASSGGAQQAIRYAQQQLGEPYQWGAAGPGSWDCSGLTMQAWGSAAVSLPHYSVAQYDATTPISVADLQPGDLVFWTSNGSPSGIHHVAMYLGGGQIIHAPRTGRPVQVDDMYYWVPPTLFGRV